MAIPFTLAGEFPAQVRQRGDDYFRRGQVAILAADGVRVDAVVRGSERYAVSVERVRRGGLEYSCTCPFAADNYVCKHIWATLLEADASVGIPGGSGPPSATRRGLAAPPGPAWTRQLRSLAQQMAISPMPTPGEAEWPQGKRLVYVVDFHETARQQDGLVVEVAMETQHKSGDWGAPKAFRLADATWQAVPGTLDREVAQMLLGTKPLTGYQSFGTTGLRHYLLAPTAFDTVLRKMLETGRGRLRHADDDTVAPLAWDAGGRWHFELEIIPEAASERFALHGVFVRGDERLALQTPEILMRGGVFVHEPVLSRFVDDGQFDLLYALRTDLSVSVDAAQLLDLLDELHRLPRLPTLRLPDGLGISTAAGEPVPRVDLATVPQPWGPDRVEATLSFDYNGTTIDFNDPRTSLFDRAKRRLIHRVRAAEQSAAEALQAAGFKRERRAIDGTETLRLAPSRTVDVSTALLNQGWQVGIEGRPIRAFLDLDVQVSSGIDWFDVQADVRFAGTTASWPELLAVIRRGERLVPLADGTHGLVPDEWIERLALLAATGTVTNDALRYGRAQAGVLDALLATAPQVRVDEVFARVRSELQQFDGIEPREAPPEFRGELRPYQCEGLGWLNFLQRLGLGGCLADDMGLGKTVQALALLEERRASGAGPSLVVVPNSLVFNWEQEAARFAPHLRVVAHVGRGRKGERFVNADLVITTYGTLRRDAVALAGVPFDYVILDEAQAIKNSGTASAKAARALRASHRLAMTGTPVENRLSELWSLFEFLNPGVLGSSARFNTLLRPAPADTPPNGADDATRALLARAIRPYILRRTKEQVAPELPARLEQTLLVDLTAADRRRYDELRDHYRASLMGKIEKSGMARSQVHVLEALLRLRQAACHPALVNPALGEEGSAKLDVLEARVSEIVAEGHKVLVFSQFTTLLAIVKRVFDAAGVVYEYLDGKTRDRERRVRRFQEDPSCPVFLISLKAGGLGLNLTAADYVFLLDPWWNPAVEAQAIDRAHRIGQLQRVFATRIIARDTVEEKVLELQEKKRDLADAIIKADGGPLSSLTREDLELLLT